MNVFGGIRPEPTQSPGIIKQPEPEKVTAPPETIPVATIPELNTEIPQLESVKTITKLHQPAVTKAKPNPGKLKRNLKRKKR